MASNRKKILITGAAGLLGRELCKQLCADNDITAVDNNQRFPDFTPQGVTYIKSEVVEYLNNTANTFDIIYHMAAINGTASFYSNPNQVLRNNTMLDLTMFAFAETNPACKLIYASSSEVVAGARVFPTPATTDIEIKNIHNARWSYRLPKILSENYLFNSDIDFLAVRFFNVYSEHTGTGHFLKDIAEKVKRKEFDLIGANETRCFCYVSDAIDALINVSHVSNIVINIGSDEEMKIEHAADIVASALGESFVPWNKKLSLPGSSQWRRPDLSVLRHFYPAFNPMPFAQAIDKIKDLL